MGEGSGLPGQVERSGTLPDSARVVVVGGGICGASALYHLAHEGWTDTVLIEKAELTSGSTWHAAGQVTHSVSSYALAEFRRYALRSVRVAGG